MAYAAARTVTRERDPGRYQRHRPEQTLDVGATLKRAFNIDIETCQSCGGAVRIVACSEDPVVIQKILDHLEKESQTPRELRVTREPGATGQ